MCSALYTENLNLVGIFGGGGGGFVSYYIPEGGCVPYFFSYRRFYSGQPILHFVIFRDLGAKGFYLRFLRFWDISS